MPPVAIGAAIGGGLGLAGSLFGPDEQTQTTTSTVDPATARFMEEARSRGLDFAAASGTAPPGIQQFQGISSELAGILPGLLSERGLTGVEGFFNPEVEGHIAATQADFDRQRGIAQQRAADVATRSGAFGGSRSAVLEAEGARNIADIEAQTVSGLRSDAFNRAAERLMEERGFRANLGFSGMQGLMGAAQFMDQRQLAALQNLGSLTSPTGETTTTTQPINRDPISGLIGGAFTGAGVASGFPGSPARGAFQAGPGMNLPYNFTLS